MPDKSVRNLAFIDLEEQRHRIAERVNQRIAAVLDHGKFILGPEVSLLEEQLAQRAGVGNAITCSSGTDALTLPLLAWEIGPGDAVFVPSFTFTATAEVVALLGATPVFCDVNPTTYNLDVDSLHSAIDAVASEGILRPRVVMPVDLFGQPASSPTLNRLAAEYGLRILTDAAQSFGAKIDGDPVGQFGDATATSFFPAKPLGCFGDGGAVFTNDDELADVLRSIRVHGKGADKYDTVRIGLNARLDTIQAAVLLSKLEIFDDELDNRATVAKRYSQGLGNAVSLPRLETGRTSAWAQYTIRIAARDELAAALRKSGVPTAVYYPRPLHEQPAYRDGVTAPGGCPVASDLAREVLSLPMHPYLNPVDQDWIIEQVRLWAEGG